MISNIDLKLDTLKSHTPSFQSVVVRQGDKASTTLDITITEDNGARPCDLTGKTAKVVAVLANGTYAEAECTVDDAESGRCTCTLDGTFGSVQGYAQDAYVEIREGDTVIGSTEGFSFYVSVGADISREQAEEYRPFIEQLATRAEDAAESAEQAAQQAKDAQEAAQGALDAVEDATAAANAAAQNANSAAAAARGNVLKGTVTDASVAHVEDAYAGAAAKEIRVTGKTRQNLWSNPPTNTQNGMALTSNADGSITLDGTASRPSYFYVDVYCLKPGASYTLSLDRSVNANVSVQSYGDSGYIDENVFVAAWSTSASGTVSQDATKFRLMVQMNAGVTIDNVTVRVMLNEGGEAEPWCPPGLTSVSELEVACAGKNLIDEKDADVKSEGFVFQKPCFFPGDSYVFSCDAESLSGSPYAEIQLLRDGESMARKTSDLVSGKNVFVLPAFDGYADTIRLYTQAPGKYSNFQLELGSQATAYEPPSVTTTPIDLDGRELRSLPDGTCDVLTWDETGAVSVEQNTKTRVIDGSENWQTGSIANRFQINNWDSDVLNQSLTYTDYYTDVLPAYKVGNDDWNSVENSVSINGRHQLFAKVAGITTVEDLKAFFASNPMTLVFPITTPQTADLAPATMPALPESTANVWAVTDPPTEVDLTYERDLTIAYDNLASQIAGLMVVVKTE